MKRILTRSQKGFEYKEKYTNEYKFSESSRFLEMNIKVKDMTEEQKAEIKRDNILRVLEGWNAPLLPEEYDNWHDYFLSGKFQMTKYLMKEMLRYFKEAVLTKGVKAEDITSAIEYLEWIIPENWDREYLYVNDILAAYSIIPKSGGTGGGRKIKNKEENPESWKEFIFDKPSPFSKNAKDWLFVKDWSKLQKDEKWQSTLISLYPKAPIYPGILYRVEMLQRYKNGEVSFKNSSFTADKRVLSLAKDNKMDDSFLSKETKKVWSEGSLPVIYSGENFKGIYRSNFSIKNDGQSEFLISGKYKVLDVKDPRTNRTRVLTNKFIEVKIGK